MLLIGVDLAWSQTNETGVVVMDPSGRVLDAGWTVGCKPTADWIDARVDDVALVFVDAPLLVMNLTGQRLCETHVGQRYWQAQVSANSTNLSSPRLGGVLLREELTRRGFIYSDGIEGPPSAGRHISECYPYTTIVGVELFGYSVRPLYKRKPPSMTMAEFRPIRSTECDRLISRMSALVDAEPSMDIRSHVVTCELLDRPSPIDDRTYKHREDLIDAALCAWTAALWWRKGLSACQVLGHARDVERPAATIIAPALPHQRR